MLDTHHCLDKYLVREKVLHDERREDVEDVVGEVLSLYDVPLYLVLLFVEDHSAEEAEGVVLLHHALQVHALSVLLLLPYDLTVVHWSKPEGMEIEDSST